MVMYISAAFQANLGATMHFNAIKEIVGKENVFVIDLRPDKQHREKNYIAYGKYKNYIGKLRRLSQGNMMFISNAIIKEICNIITEKNINAVFIEDSVYGNLVKSIKKKCSQIWVITFYHDLKADLFKQWIKNKNLVGKIECSIGIRQEKINQQYADVNLVFNKRDADLFTLYYGRRPEGIIALPAAVPDSCINNETVTRENETKTLLFVGKKYFPNLVGLRWFAKNVLPFLNPDITIQIVGQGLECMRDELTDFRFQVIGEVKSLDTYYREADIVIAPLFDGGGMKTKTVEALSYGKMFVGTKESLFGFWEEMDGSIRNKTVFQIDTAREWIETINRLSKTSIAKFNQNEFELFLNKFSYETARDKLKHYILEAGQ